MPPTTTTQLTGDLLDEVGRPVDPDNPHDVHRVSVGPFDLVLRRDCHGVLRKMEVSFPNEMREVVRERVCARGWQVVAPGDLDLLDIAGLGKLYLLSERLDIVFRMNAAREIVTRFVSRCLDSPRLASIHKDVAPSVPPNLPDMSV